METQVKVTDEESFNSALEIIAENPVNIYTANHDWFNVKDTDFAMDVVGKLAAQGTPVRVEIAMPKPGVEVSLHPTHHIVPRVLVCPKCRTRANDYGGNFRRNMDEYGVVWVTCNNCKWRGSEMAI